MNQVVIIGGGITGLTAAYRLRKLAPDVAITLVEADDRPGGKLVTHHVAGLTIEGAPDSFLARKARGVALCEELGLGSRLYGRRPEHADKTEVKYGGALYPLPSGLSGMIPTNLDALANNPLISPQGRLRLAEEVNIGPAAPNGDESVAHFVTRRLGREVYEKLVEPLMSGIYAGDGKQLSLTATFPQLRELELKHGSLLKGLQIPSTQAPPASPQAPAYPPFVSLRGGIGELVDALVAQTPALDLRLGTAVTRVQRATPQSAYQVELSSGKTLDAAALIITTPAYVTAQLLAQVDPALAAAHAAIPYASSALVTLAYNKADLTTVPEGYGYVVPSVTGSDILACTFSSNKWANRAPEEMLLLRVYIGRYGHRDVTQCSDSELLAMAQAEVAETHAITAQPAVARVYRWPLSMPQYNLGHPELLGRIAARLTENPGLLVAGAAYRGVGIPDCIREGEDAATGALHYRTKTTTAS